MYDTNREVLGKLGIGVAMEIESPIHSSFLRGHIGGFKHLYSHFFFKLFGYSI